MKDNSQAFRKRAIVIFLFFNISLLTAALVYAFFTEAAWQRGDELMPCFFKHSLHFYCPGCGGSHALVALLKLDPVSSFIYSPAVVVAFLLIVYADILALISIIRNNPSYIKRFNLNLLLIIPVVIILNFAVKNILLFGFGIDVIGDFSGKPLFTPNY